MKLLFAYLDAGTGSLIVQAAIGAVIAIGVFLKTFWSRVTSVFRRDKKPLAATAGKTADTNKLSK